MKTIKNILLVLDDDEAFSDSPGNWPIELKKALRLVKDKDSTNLTLLCVAYQKYLHHDFLSMDFNQLQRRQEYCEQLSKNLTDIETLLQNQGYKVESSVVWGYPRYETIISKAKEIVADLVIQHCRSYGKMDFHHLSNDSWQLVRHCPTPLLLVKNKDWHEIPTVVAAVDPVHSHHKPLALDYRILDAAQTIGEALAAKLHVVHAYAEAARPFAPAGVIKSEHRKALDELLSFYSIPAERLHFVDEAPIYALQETIVDIDADLVTMGAISRSRLSEMLIGSTAEKVIDFLETDVLIIKPTPS